MRYANSRETDRRSRVSLERQWGSQWRAGIDVVPGSGEVTPRAVYSWQAGKAFGHFGASSTRTATEEGNFAGFGLAGYRAGAVSFYGGYLVEFGGRARPVSGIQLTVLPNLYFESFADANEIHLTVGYRFESYDFRLTRSATARWGISLGVGF